MDFSKLTKYLDSLPGGVPSVDLAVYRDHQCLYRHSAGFRDEKKTRPIQGDETYNLFSCTKVFTTCAAMQLIQEGKLYLDDPVSDYLPAYGHLTVKDGDTVRPAKRVMTVRHLMSMQSGLNYDMGTPCMQKAITELGDAATTRQLVDAKAGDPLEFDPGEDFMYSLSHDVLAAVIEAASGQRFSAYLKEHIFEPLGLKTMSFFLTEELLSRHCDMYVFNGDTQSFELSPMESNNYHLAPQYESGGAGLIGDVKDCACLADALACGGRSKEGRDILSPEMIQLWSANQLGPKGRKSFDGWKRLGYSYALGVRTRVDNELGGRGQIGEFGWDGAAGAWMMIDPHHRLSAFFAMHVRNFGYSYDVIHPTLRNLIYEALERKRG